MAEPTDPGHVSAAIDTEREALLKALVDHGVQFVVIGGAGIQSHGRRYDTLDIDLTPDRDEANLVVRDEVGGRDLELVVAVGELCLHRRGRVIVSDEVEKSAS